MFINTKLFFWKEKLSIQDYVAHYFATEEQQSDNSNLRDFGIKAHAKLTSCFMAN